MKASQLLRILELGIPVIGTNHIYRLIDNKLQIGVSCNREPAYMGDQIASLFALAEELTEADEINLTYMVVQVKERKSANPKIFEHEKEYFKQLECEVPEDLTF